MFEEWQQTAIIFRVLGLSVWVNLLALKADQENLKFWLYTKACEHRAEGNIGCLLTIFELVLPSHQDV
jgi:hypothetical protein